MTKRKYTIIIRFTTFAEQTKQEEKTYEIEAEDEPLAVARALLSCEKCYYLYQVLSVKVTVA